MNLARQTLRPGRAALRGLLLCAALLLSACSTPPVQRQGTQSEAFWQGRLSLRIDSEPAQFVSAGFELRGSDQRGELLLSSPLGNTLARLDWSPTHATWQQGEQVTQRSHLHELGQDLLGTPLPIQSLFDWLSGQPGDETQGWQADLSRQPQGRITARRTHPLPSAELRLVYSQESP